MNQAADHPERKLLIISYWYPSAVGAAAERAHAFARYLPEHGWDCHVVTARRKRQPPTDPGVSVHNIPGILAVKDQAFGDYDPRRKPSRLKAYLRGFTFPDRFLLWQRFAFRPARKLIRRRKIDLILASFPPASAVQLALRLCRETDVPMVLDFRDRWFGPGGYEPRRARARLAHQRLESQAVSAASAVIAVSEAMADAIADEQGFDRKRIFVIPNGYEPAGQTGAPPRSAIPNRQPPIPLTIAHVGTVIPRNRPDLFFQSIAELKARKCLGDVTFRFVGNLSQAYIDDAGLAPVVETTGLLPQAEALREMEDAEALLLLTGSYVGRWGHNAKLFEYVRTGRPVLCLEETPGSNDRKLLEQFAHERAFFAPVDEPGSIARALDGLRQYVSRQPSQTARLNKAFQAYSRRNLVARLAGHLDTIIPRNAQ